MMKTLTMHLEQSYPIYIGSQLLSHPLLLIEHCQQLKKQIVIITDSCLVNTLGKDLQAYLRQANVSCELLFFPAGEQYKTRESKQQLEDQLFAKKFGRDTCLLALGGGVVTDLVGFIGATYCRGVTTIYLPTSLLAMVDASIGGKTGVNTPHGKNLIGSFYQPEAVFMDVNVLKTLPSDEWRNGTVEMIKHGLILDKDFFLLMKNNYPKIKEKNSDFLTKSIYYSCQIKKNIVEQDEKDNGIRQILNFGHTIGHAIEVLEDYQISHGEAVAIGMLVEAYLALEKGLLNNGVLNEIEAILQIYQLPLQTKAFLQRDKFFQVLKLDKKAINKYPRFILLESIGKVHQDSKAYATAVDVTLLDNALHWAEKRFSTVKMDV